MVLVYRKDGSEFIKIGEYDAHTYSIVRWHEEDFKSDAFVRRLRGKVCTSDDSGDSYRPVYRGELPGHSDEDTSRDAAKSIRGVAGRIQREVYTAIRDSKDGLTVYELIDKLGYIKDSIAPRVTELVKLRRLRDSGKKRETPSGRRAKVWILSRG